MDFLLKLNRNVFLLRPLPLLLLPFISPPVPFPFLPLLFPYPLPSNLSLIPPLPLSIPSPYPSLPPFMARGLTERLSSPSGSGRSTAAKRFLVLIKLKILHLVCILRRWVDFM